MARAPVLIFPNGEDPRIYAFGVNLRGDAGALVADLVRTGNAGPGVGGPPSPPRLNPEASNSTRPNARHHAGRFFRSLRDRRRPVARDVLDPHTPPRTKNHAAPRPPTGPASGPCRGASKRSAGRPGPRSRRRPGRPSKERQLQPQRTGSIQLDLAEQRVDRKPDRQVEDHAHHGGRDRRQGRAQQAIAAEQPMYGCRSAGSRKQGTNVTQVVSSEATTPPAKGPNGPGRR